MLIHRFKSYFRYKYFPNVVGGRSGMDGRFGAQPQARAARPAFGGGGHRLGDD